MSAVWNLHKKPLQTQTGKQWLQNLFCCQKCDSLSLSDIIQYTLYLVILQWGQLTLLVILQSHRNLSASAPCSRTVTKTDSALYFGAMGCSLKLPGHPPAHFCQLSLNSSAATVSLTLQSRHCWCWVWEMFALVFSLCLKWIRLHSFVKWPSDDYSLWPSIPFSL